MEKNSNVSFDQFVDLMNRIKYFTVLKEVESNRDQQLHKVELVVSGYIDLSSMLIGFLKLCIVALEQDDFTGSDGRSLRVHVLGMLEIILQLFPYTEFELMEELHKCYLRQDL